MRPWLPAALGTLLAFLSLAFGSFDPLWDLVGLVDSPVRPALTISLSLASLAIGFFKAILNELDKSRRQVSDFQRNLPDFLSSRVPQLKVFGIYETDDANEIISGKLDETKSALNTRVFSDAFERDHPVSEQINDILCLAIQNGLRFKEVAGPALWATCERRMSRLNKPKGRYEVGRLDNAITLLNFIILCFPNDEKEVWFGWPIGAGASGEELTVVTSEPRVVQLFEHWHRELFAATTERMTSAVPSVAQATA